jgi:FkbM family methyltransferase
MLKEQLKAIVRLLARHGVLVVWLRKKFGFDVWYDIRQLASISEYDLNVFFDVGANVGEVSIRALRELPGIKVIAFEPHPETFVKLSARTGVTRPQILAVNSAVSSTAGNVDMFVYDNHMINSLVENAPYAALAGYPAKRITVPCTTLDAYCLEKKISRIDILKIDTEGHDLAVLEGAMDLLRAGAVKFVYVEFNELQQRGDAVAGALAPIDTLLRQYGFKFIASYVDYVIPTGEMFSVSNALFALPRERAGHT